MSDFGIIIRALMLPLLWLMHRAIRYYRVNPNG